MNISPVFFNTFYKTNQNRSNNVVYANNQLPSDCFTKSNNVSFGTSNKKEQRQQNISSFMKDLNSKIWSPNFSISDISNAMRKYVKNVSVKPMNQAPREIVFADSLQGLYCEEVGFDESTNKFLISKKNKVFYTKTETLKNQLGNVWVFVNATHELTHALQSEDENANSLKIFNNYIEKNNNNIDSAVEQVASAIKTVNIIEESIARPLINLLVINENMAYDRVQAGRTDILSWLCRKNKTEDFCAYVKEKTLEGIKAAEESLNITLDKSLILDTTINHFKKELEAYENENKAFKMCLKMESPRSLARIQIYKKAIEALEEMKKE